MAYFNVLVPKGRNINKKKGPDVVSNRSDNTENIYVCDTALLQYLQYKKQISRVISKI